MDQLPLDFLKREEGYSGNATLTNETLMSAITGLKEKLSVDRFYRNELKFCPLCNSRIEDRTISLYKELISDLYKVYCWCGKNKRHEFKMKDIRHGLSRNNYARFGDLVRFGGLVYKFKDDNGKRIKGSFGLNMARCKEFFNGQRSIPLHITLNQITNEIIDSKYVTVRDFPELNSYLDQNGLYDYEKIF